ncbi:MAG: 30S ribosomal protein S6 [Oscillospiraceae bacterium]|nr:30S ribosomal protein S6 [Oscillospiraceae bacterium]
MAKVTGKYEVIYIIDCALGEEEIAAAVEKFKALVAENGSLIGEIDEWGKRRLAYPINDKEEGYYVLMRFESAPGFPAELDRVFKITDGIMRSLIINTDGE